METILAVAGTLLGTLLGTVGAHLSHQSGFRHEATERLAITRRQAYIGFLTDVNDIYRQVQGLSRQFRQGQMSADAMVEALRQVPSAAGQAALENVRLVATRDVAANAALLWAHLRRSAVAQGASRSTPDWRAWQDRYWELRRNFLDAARADTGFEPLDWETAGVHNQPSGKTWHRQRSE